MLKDQESGQEELVSLSGCSYVHPNCLCLISLSKKSQLNSEVMNKAHTLRGH